MKLEYKNDDLMSKLDLKDKELKYHYNYNSQIKEMYENELKLKFEIYNQNLAHLNKLHKDEIKKIRIDYENKLDEVIRKSEGVIIKAIT